MNGRGRDTFIAWVMGIIAITLSWNADVGADIEPCEQASPPPPTLSLRLVDSPLCISDPMVIGQPLVVEVDISGLDPDGADEFLARGAQVFLLYTSETCAGGAPAIEFSGFDPGEPGDFGSPDASPFQEQIATEHTPPVIGLNPGLLRCAIGIPPGGPPSACDNAIVSLTFTPLAEGALSIWFRDPATPPMTKLADDTGAEIAPPDLVLAQPDETQALTILVDFTAPELNCPPDLAVQRGGSTATSATGQAVAADNCDPASTVTYADAITAGACAAQYTLNRTWTATDACGNARSCMQVIQVGSASDCQADPDNDDNPSDDNPPDENPPAGQPTSGDDAAVAQHCCCGEVLCGICTPATMPVIILSMGWMKRRAIRART